MHRIRHDDAVVLDVRDVSEYEAEHAAGARSVPLDELETALKSLPKNREIVAYYRGLYRRSDPIELDQVLDVQSLSGSLLTGHIFR